MIRMTTSGRHKQEVGEDGGGDRMRGRGEARLTLCRESLEGKEKLCLCKGLPHAHHSGSAATIADPLREMISYRSIFHFYAHIGP